MEANMPAKQKKVNPERKSCRFQEMGLQLREVAKRRVRGHAKADPGSERAVRAGGTRRALKRAL